MGPAALPKWQSHKVVEGDKITRVWQVGLTERVDGNDSGYRWELACGEIVKVSLDLFNRVPYDRLAITGHYVRYEDGFESWSPSEAFEKGYTRI
jgi:hypothetical protein